MTDPDTPTQMPSESDVSNGDALSVITQNNNKWQKSNDKLKNLQNYVKTLTDKGVIK